MGQATGFTVGDRVRVRADACADHAGRTAMIREMPNGVPLLRFDRLEGLCRRYAFVAAVLLEPITEDAP